MYVVQTAKVDSRNPREFLPFQCLRIRFGVVVGKTARKQNVAEILPAM